MKHTYHIEGMTCNGCRSQVEKTLSEVEGATHVSVNLEKEEAIIDMKYPIDIGTFQQVLPKKYGISEKKAKGVFDSTFAGPIGEQKPEKSKLEQLKPLLIILFYISVASILLHRDDWDITQMMLDFMGLFYIVFSFFKLLDLNGFPDSFRMYDPLAKVLPAYAWAYPFIETALGLMFLLRFQTSIALVVTLIVLGITTFGVTKTLLDKKSIQCACLGTALKLPMTEATFIENAIMIVMAIIMLANLI